MNGDRGARRSVGLVVTLLLTCSAAAAAELPRLNEARVRSTIDGKEQPIRLRPGAATAGTATAGAATKAQPTPLLVSLHSWSGDYTQDRSEWLHQAVERDWIYLQPNFRGVNQHPEACGSPLARQDILDAIQWTIEHYAVDESRIYLAGVSGGGHMTMLMAGYHPERFSAVSAWVGISDLAAWYRFHRKDGQPQRYAQMMAASCGGAPGDSLQVDEQYHARSPVHFLSQVGDLHVDLNAGVQDGKTGSVPIHHTLRAFNAIARGNGGGLVSDAEMDQLWRQDHLDHPRPEDVAADAHYGREIRLRRRAGHARVTIFDGGHEGLPSAACAWLATKSRPTRGPAAESPRSPDSAITGDARGK